MKLTFLWHYRHMVTGTSLLFVLALTLVACSSGAGSGTPPAVISGTPVATTSGGSSTSPVPGVHAGPQPCPTAAGAPSHWDTLIGTQTNINKVESVTCANLLGNATLQALINVRFDGTGAILDVYVYNNITNPTPTQIFKLQDLYKGDAKISAYNTVITGEVDQNSSVNKNASSNAALVQDLYREFKWSSGAGTLVPVAFPGIFPDLTRYQAETDQEQVNQGHSPWKLDAKMSANTFAISMLKWPNPSITTIVSGGGQHDINAIVNVKNPVPVGGTIQLTMSRLEGNANGGIWIVISVGSADMTIISPAKLDRLASPVAVVVTGNGFENTVDKDGFVSILDHTYTDIGHTNAIGTIGETHFATTVAYNSSFKGGSQEGIIAYSRNYANGSVAGIVMVKVLLSA